MLTFVAILSMLTMPVLASENVPTPRGAYIRTLVGYDSSYLTYQWEYKKVGTASGDNTSGSGPMTINFTYSSTGSISASYGSSTLLQYEKNLIIDKVSLAASFDVSNTRSWTAGRSYSGSLEIAPGKKQLITGYIPRISTRGSLKYKVYMDGYPNNYWYEYTSLSSTYLPAKDHVHFVTSNIQ